MNSYFSHEITPIPKAPPSQGEVVINTCHPTFGMAYFSSLDGNLDILAFSCHLSNLSYDSVGAQYHKVISFKFSGSKAVLHWPLIGQKYQVRCPSDHTQPHYVKLLTTWVGFGAKPPLIYAHFTRDEEIMALSFRQIHCNAQDWESGGNAVLLSQSMWPSALLPSHCVFVYVCVLLSVNLSHGVSLFCRTVTGI